MEDIRKNTVSVLENLIEINNDGNHGYRLAADKIENPEYKTLFHAYAQQRAQFAAELEREANLLGRDPDAGLYGQGFSLIQERKLAIDQQFFRQGLSIPEVDGIGRHNNELVPSSLATVSQWPAMRLKRLAASLIRASPASCPKVSFTVLRLSSPIRIRATWVPFRSAWARTCSSRL